jgi:hypothetical protein
MLERADFITQRLKAAASAGGGTEVGVDFDQLIVNGETFNLVSFIEIRA